ncbi:ATP-binding protein [Niveispirillum fermenti]|uniref:ATP-binding protein n=1 Tax=Niveispirillum fermenti TaxID=1233113 RepID=UPI003A86FD8F
MQDSVTDFFGLPDDIARLLSGRELAGEHAVRIKVLLAWYLRQRDTAKSLRLLTELAGTILDTDGRPDLVLHARALLAEAECMRLVADLPRTALLLDQATRLFADADDRLGLGDCAFSRGETLLLQGDLDNGFTALREAVGHYRAGDDAVRVLIAEAWLANQEQYNSPDEARGRWDPQFLEHQHPTHPAACAFLLTYKGSVAFQDGDFPQAIRLWEQGFEHSIVAGAVSLSIHLAMVTGSAYANLFDLPMALEWKEKAHAIAKPTGWPEALGATLSSMAETTTSLGQYERALALFEESLPYLGRLPGSRRHSIAYCAYGNLCIAMNEPQAALEWYQRADAIAQRLGHPDVELYLQSALTTALLKLGRLEEAEARITRPRAIARTQGNPYYEIEALRALASVRRAQDHDPSRAVALLEQAIAVGAALQGMTIKSEMYEELARDYEALGNHRQALFYERRARDSWQRNFDRQNGARILAMQVRFDTARARSEAEHHRKLAEAEATRAAELDRANQTLEKLGSIGQEITARLDSEAVFTTLSEHLQDLMHVNTLFLGLKDETNQIIDIRYRMEDSRRLPPRQVQLASDTLSARCVRDNEEILMVWDRRSPATLAGTRHMRTVLYRPLTIGDRVLGVVSVQSDRASAYGPRELLIFRTICAYGAIAMANAVAYQQLDRAVAELREALQRLVQQEKMAALGQLVAGVAHEVNTPLGVTLSAVSQLNDTIRQTRDHMAHGTLTRTALAETLQNGQDLAALAQRNVVRAADMVRTFKSVAVDHGSDERRRFDLGDYLKEIVTLMRARVSANGSRVEMDVPSIQMDTYPGALAQAMTNLIANVADHAYGADAPGTIRIQARRLDQRLVEIAVADDGRGIAPDILPKVFDPFFTTRRAAGSMGLGLHVTFNQVTQRLNGTILIDSVPGQGTVATIRIPCEVPGGPPVALATPAH